MRQFARDCLGGDVQFVVGLRISGYVANFTQPRGELNKLHQHQRLTNNRDVFRDVLDAHGNGLIQDLLAGILLDPIGFRVDGPRKLARDQRGSE